MGFFRRGSLDTAVAAEHEHEHQDQHEHQHETYTIPNTRTSYDIVALLKTKVANLEDKLSQKETLIVELQEGLESNLNWMNKLDSISTASNSCLLPNGGSRRHSAATTTSSSSMRHGEFAPSSCLKAAAAPAPHPHPMMAHFPGEDFDIVSQLSAQNDEKSLAIKLLEVQLEEQRLLAHHYQERLEMTAAGKSELVAQVQQLKKQVFDQANQIECLQSLNETNSSIVQEMELVSHTTTCASASASSSTNAILNQRSATTLHQRRNGSQTPTTKWEMYGKLQKLMDTNNKLSQQLAKALADKQAGDLKLMDQQVEKKQMKKQIDTLQQQLQQSEAELIQWKRGDYTCLDTSTCEINDPYSNYDDKFKSSVLPEIQQVLDLFGHDDDDDDTTTSTNGSNPEDTTPSSHPSKTSIHKDPQLLRISLKACQSKLQQLQRDRDSQLAKALKQSLALATSQEQVDTLQAKVEHYENILDAALIGNYCLSPTPVSGKGTPLPGERTPSPPSHYHPFRNTSGRHSSSVVATISPDLTPCGSPLSLGSPGATPCTATTSSTADSPQQQQQPLHFHHNPGRVIRRLILPKFIRKGA